MEKKINKMCTTSFIVSMLFIVIGLFLFIRPDTTLSIISYIIGGILLATGIYSCYKYFSGYSIGTIFNFELVYGVLLSIAGLYLIFKPTALGEIFPVILGIWIIINSVTKFQYALVLKKIQNQDWAYTALISLLTFIWGIILLFNPLKAMLAVTQIIGIFVIVYAFLDIVDNFIIRKNVKVISEKFKEEQDRS